MFGLRKKQSVEPIPYSPLRVPPMGSLGALYDEHINLPLLPHEVLTQGKKKPRRKLSNKQIESLRPDEVRFLRYRAPSHALAVIAWMLLVCAVTTTGSAITWRAPLLAAAVICAIITLVLIRSSRKMHGGKWQAIGACVAAVALAGMTWYQYGTIPIPF